MKTVEVRGEPALYFDAEQGRTEGQPNIVFLHGSGCDHTVWAGQSRYFAFHKWNVFALNLPGHGPGSKVSGGSPLTSIEDMADWVIDFLDAAEIEDAVFVGHSMGTLYGLEVAARAPDRVKELVLMGSTLKMPVHPELLRASDACEPKSVELMMDWGHGPQGHLGGHISAGTWTKGAARRMMMSRVLDGTLGIDMAACNAYSGGDEVLSKIAAPTTVIAAQFDKMTPAKNGKAIADALEGARYMLLPNVGHMMMGEAPNECLAALRGALRV